MKSVDELCDRLLAFSERILVFFSQFLETPMLSFLRYRPLEFDSPGKYAV